MFGTCSIRILSKENRHKNPAFFFHGKNFLQKKNGGFWLICQQTPAMYQRCIPISFRVFWWGARDKSWSSSTGSLDTKLAAGCIRENPVIKPSLGGGFKHLLFSSQSLGKWSNLTNIFQMGWNHQQASYIGDYHRGFLVYKGGFVEELLVVSGQRKFSWSQFVFSDVWFGILLDELFWDVYNVTWAM